MLNVRRALTYMFEDADWPAIFLVGGVFSLIPVAGMLVQVYFFPTLRQIATGQPDDRLADWPGFGTLISRALRYIVLGLFFLLFAIPLLIVFAIMAIGYVEEVLETKSGESYPGFFEYFLTPNRAPLLALLLLCGFLVMIVANACTARFAVTDSIGDSLPFGAVLSRIFAEPIVWVVAVFITLCVTMLPVQLVGLLPIDGPAGFVSGLLVQAATGIYGWLVGIHLVGQAYRRADQTIARNEAARLYRWVPPQAP